jgi:hypothetical protein
MLKLVYAVRRKPEMPLVEFQRYWLEEHGGLSKKLKEDMPTFVHYVQSHTVYGEATDKVRAARGTAEPFDGITEAWFDNSIEVKDAEAQMKAVGQMLADEAHFIDAENSVVFYTEEHEIF